MIFKDTETNHYINNYLKFKDNLATPIISKCACSTLVALANNYCFSSDNTYKPIRGWGFYRYKPDEIKDCIKFAVIRNPLERIESAYNTIGNNMPINDYIESVIKTLNNSEIDRHIASQFLFYNINDIDIFVPIERLDDYLRSIGIKLIRINCSKNPIKINDSRLDILLEDDFEIYNKLLEKSYVVSGK